MKRKRHIVIFTIITLLLTTVMGCGSDKELWEVLEEAQYNRYKLRLDHMVKKYGYKLSRVILLYFDEELYAQVGRMPEVNVNVWAGTMQVTGAEGYRVALYRRFEESEYYRYFLDLENNLSWWETEHGL